MRYERTPDGLRRALAALHGLYGPMTDTERAAHASAVAAVRKQDELRRQPQPDLLEQANGTSTEIPTPR